MSMSRKRPLTEWEKQFQPMPGEVDPKDAMIQARIAVVRAAARLRFNKFDPGRDRS